ncbi:MULTISPECIES: hypothetical protein [unclassified Pseudomonas]|uniref:hypothetical protein n=1 Tax=unclassified Pseudomonas TaxID=196821 RepID=UPI00244BB506|nr:MULTISPECIES: hypothetical protein [unclassified Pseudomonas]MDH0301691.1 hypothetical protein [Pseudomonas sp. GD04091]MDH1984910.1 hypothetical protein [Pseudomonas sp. GD03689]
MPGQPVSKLEIAVELLDSAIAHYLDPTPRYFSAISLAGAAEELLGKFAERAGQTHAADSLSQAALRIARSFEASEKTTLSSIRQLMNHARNATKHMDPNAPSHVEFDPREAARDLIDRAMTNYYSVARVAVEELPENVAETERMSAYNQQRHG